jgi:hypothetical protein
MRSSGKASSSIADARGSPGSKPSAIGSFDKLASLAATPSVPGAKTSVRRKGAL